MDTPKKLYIVYMLTYALMSVLGIAIGIGITSAGEHSGNSYKGTVGVLQVSYQFKRRAKSLKSTIFHSHLSYFEILCLFSIIKALTGGTLLYVAVFEILEREKAKVKVPGLVQFFCVVLGFSTIMMLEILSRCI